MHNPFGRIRTIAHMTLPIVELARLPATPINPFQSRLPISFLIHPFFIHLIVFFALSLTAFHRNNDFLFFGTDGRFEVTLIQQFSHFAPSRLGFTSDILRGLGNVVFPVNPHWIPSYILGITGQHGHPNFALTYAVASSELFVATFLIARLIQLPPVIGIASAWIVPLVTMPYSGFGLIPHTVAAFPHYATILAATSLLTALCIVIGARPQQRNIVAGTLLIFCVGYIVVIAPTVLILGVPLALVTVLVSCAASRSRRELILKVSTFGLTGAACLVVFGPYLAGLLFNTAADVFKGLSMRPATLQDFSMLFWAPFLSWTPAQTLIIGGLTGALVVAGFGTGRMRIAAIGLFATEALLLVIGALQFVRPFWFGPALWYFEGFLYGYFSVFLCAGIYFIGRLLIMVAAPLSAQVSVSSSRLLSLSGVLIAIGGAVYFLSHDRTVSAHPSYIPHPQAETSITKILKEEISFMSDRRFRGRVGEFNGRSLRWSNDFQIWHFLRLFAFRDTGNMHSGPSLWQDAIPTLAEYSPQMTPAYFAFTRRFFTFPGDIQSRNWVQMRKVDPRLLATLGVRFVITDAPLGGAAFLRARIPVRVTESLRSGFYAPGEFRNHDFALHLYELPGVNLGHYSPTSVVQARDAAGILKALGSPDLDPTRTVITHEPVPQPLVEAQLQEFSVDRGVTRIRATSSGRSLLLLPIEYSKCLTIANAAVDASSTPTARLLRADLVLTGLLFETAVDVTIHYFTGPFFNSTCRLKDRRELEALDISNAFREHVDFLPK